MYECGECLHVALKGNLNREYHIYLAYIGSVTRSIHIQMGFNLHSHYSYN